MNSRVSNKNRIQELDALRGIALFGILLVNIFVFHAPIAYYGEFYGAFKGIQGTAVNFVVEFAGGKFLLIFAFMFGYGIVLQKNSRKQNFNSYFMKRMMVLFLFGGLHIILFWFGDILAAYALLGLLVLPLLKLSNRNILILGIFFILFSPLYHIGVVLFNWTMVHIGKPVGLEEFISVFQGGSYLEILKLRMTEFLAFMPENLVWYLPKTLGIFLIGIYAARKSFFTRIRENSKGYLIASLVLIVTSVIWILFKLDLFRLFDLEAQPLMRPLLIGMIILFNTALGFGYIIGFSLVFQNFKLPSKILAKTGRLALTNYILQSLLCIAIFYGFGLGYYSKLKPTDLVIISMAVFGFNVLFSHVYLKYKRSGPLEYLWRKMIKNGKGNS